MLSNWEETKKNSSYHFDNFKIDPNFDRVLHLGKIKDDFSQTIKEAIEYSKPATWETRGYKGEGVLPPREDLIKEEYDLEKTGYGKDYVITHMNWEINDQLNRISKMFCLKDCMERIHIQKPGEVWNLHIDKLQKWCPDDPSKVLRVFIHLTDWEQGHFWSFGNYNYSQWRAGDVFTFDWENLPHSTANAGHTARVTFQITGVKTKKTDEFLQELSLTL